MRDAGFSCPHSPPKRRLAREQQQSRERVSAHTRPRQPLRENQQSTPSTPHTLPWTPARFVVEAQRIAATDCNMVIAHNACTPARAAPPPQSSRHAPPPASSIACSKWRTRDNASAMSSCPAGSAVCQMRSASRARCKARGMSPQRRQLELKLIKESPGKKMVRK